MASWKKVIVSGSAAHVTSVTASALTNDNILIASSSGEIQSSGITFNGSVFNLGSSVTASAGIFTGSFVGDASGLTGFGTDLSIAGDTGAGTILLASEILAFTGVGLTTVVTNNAVSHSISYGSSSATSVEGSTTISLTGTANEVEITGTTAQTLGSAPSYTIGLPSNVTIGNDLTVVGGLFVQGTTTTINTANLLVEDKYILLNSGSVSPHEGGIIIGASPSGSGHGFFFDSGSTPRWGYNSTVSNTATTADATAWAAVVVDIDGPHTDRVEYRVNGNIKIDGGEIFIYS